MAAKSAGYTGSIVTDVEVGYTSGEGYTGSIHVPVTSGFTGSAPVTSRGRSRTSASPPAQSRGAVLAGSPYDASIVDRDQTPGSSVLHYEPPPPRSEDLGPGADEDEDSEGTPVAAGVADADESVSGSSGAGDDVVGTLAALVRSRLDYLDQLRISPFNSGGPRSRQNNALRRAQSVIRGASEGALRWPEESLTAPAAEALKRQVGEVIAQSRPNNLGVAYLEGVVQGLIEEGISMGAGVVDAGVDPLGMAYRTGKAVADAMAQRMAEGDNWFEAAIGVLDPAVAIFEEGSRANDIAGEALAARRRGDWAEAVRLARDAGRAAARGGVAAGQTAGMAMGAAEMITTLQKRRGAPRPPEPTPLPHLPEREGVVPRQRTEVDPIPVAPADRPDGVIGRVDPTAPGRAPTRRPHTRPHPAYGNVPIADPEYTEALLRAERNRRQGLEQIAADELARIRESRRITQDDLTGRAKAIRNSRERETMLMEQRAHPDWAVGTDVHIRGVRHTDGRPPTPVTKITSDGTGRIPDGAALLPDGEFRSIEMKNASQLDKAYGVPVDALSRGVRASTGPVEATALKSSTYRTQLRREREILDFAQPGDIIEVRLRTVDGSFVDVDVPRERYKIEAARRYGELPQ